MPTYQQDVKRWQKDPNFKDAYQTGDDPGDVFIDDMVAIAKILGVRYKLQRGEWITFPDYPSLNNM